MTDPLAHLTPQDLAARFYAALLGGVVADGPPPADSPLGRVQALRRALESRGASVEDVDVAVRAAWTQEWRQLGLNVDSGADPWE